MPMSLSCWLLCVLCLGCAGPGALFGSLSSSPGEGRGPRSWARAAHLGLRELLPRGAQAAVFSEQLPALAGERGLVYRHFGWAHADHTSVLGNPRGLLHTSRAARGDAPGAGGEPEPWPGFSSVWVPVTDGVRLFGRLGVGPARPGPRTAIIVALGLFGDLDGVRYRELSQLLFREGYVVLCLEPRGHGRSGASHPEVPMTFGVLESIDLLHAARWLRAAQGIDRVGLIGFSWGALSGLLAAWVDGLRPGVEALADPIWRRVSEAGGPGREGPAFDAGVLAFSPVLDVVALGRRFETAAAFLRDPARYFLQHEIAVYLERRGVPADHRVWPFVRHELLRSELAREMGGDAGQVLKRALSFLWLGAEKLGRVRAPLLIVHGVDDPVVPAREVAALFAATDNPNVSGILMSGGGHIGLSSLAPAYYRSVILRFFDPRRGPRAERVGSPRRPGRCRAP